MKKPLRVVFDTNILISGILWRGSPYKCLYLAKSYVVESITCQQILKELQEKLIRKFTFSAKRADDVIQDITAYSQLINIPNELKVLEQDPDDDKFIECALVSKSELIVSGDHHLLDLKKYKGIEIINATDLLRKM